MIGNVQAACSHGGDAVGRRQQTLRSSAAAARRPAGRASGARPRPARSSWHPCGLWPMALAVHRPSSWGPWRPRPCPLTWRRRLNRRSRGPPRRGRRRRRRPCRPPATRVPRRCCASACWQVQLRPMLSFLVPAFSGLPGFSCVQCLACFFQDCQSLPIIGGCPVRSQPGTAACRHQARHA